MRMSRPVSHSGAGEAAPGIGARRPGSGATRRRRPGRRRRPDGAAGTGPGCGPGGARRPRKIPVAPLPRFRYGSHNALYGSPRRPGQGAPPAAEILKERRPGADRRPARPSRDRHGRPSRWPRRNHRARAPRPRSPPPNCEPRATRRSSASSRSGSGPPSSGRPLAVNRELVAALLADRPRHPRPPEGPRLGRQVIDRLAGDLRRAFPGIERFLAAEPQVHAGLQPRHGPNVPQLCNAGLPLHKSPGATTSCSSTRSRSRPSGSGTPARPSRTAGAGTSSSTGSRATSTSARARPRRTSRRPSPRSSPTSPARR